MASAPDPARNVRDAAALYISKGWRVVPLAPNSKAAVDNGWLSLVFKPDDFEADDNIGIRSVNGLIDVDKDAPEVVACADKFLPATGCVYGRKSKPRSHSLYLSSFEKSIAFKDAGAGEDHKATLIEVRVNHQSMAPPSMHPDNELIAWDGILGEPATVEPPALMRAVRLTATCALVSRYYMPPGDRHDWGIALAGFLRHLGLTEGEATDVFTEAANWVRDDKIKDRLTEIRTTFSKPDEDPLAGGKALREKMPKGKEFVASLQKIWGGKDAAGGGFILTEKGDKIAAGAVENIRRALAKLDVELTYDVFAERPQITRHGKTETLEDRHLHQLWFEIDAKYHFRPGIELFTVFLQTLSREKSHHPVLTYLDGLTWDGQPRIDQWLVDCAGAADSDYVRAVGRMMLIAAVKRVRHPGCKFDEIVVLESEQGKLKSSALRALCPKEDWFSDDLPLNVDSKQIIERTLGKWIIEVPELSGLHGSQKEHLKAMLSRPIDGPVRMAYARLPVERARQFIVIGTTNNHAYLQDDTGNRRFWPVRVEMMDIAKIIAMRDQLWAEAAAREKNGESIRLNPALYPLAELQQERRRIEDPFEQILIVAYPRTEKHRLTPSKIWNTLGISADRRTLELNRRLSGTLSRLGFRRLSVRNDDGVVEKGWARDPLEGNHEFAFMDKDTKA